MEFSDVRQSVEDALTEPGFDWLGVDSCPDAVWQKLTTVKQFRAYAEKVRAGGGEKTLRTLCERVAWCIAAASDSTQRGPRGQYRKRVTRALEVLAFIERYAATHGKDRFSWRVLSEQWNAANPQRTLSLDATKQLYYRNKDTAIQYVIASGALQDVIDAVPVIALGALQHVIDALQRYRDTALPRADVVHAIQQWQRAFLASLREGSNKYAYEYLIYTQGFVPGIRATKRPPALDSPTPRLSPGTPVQRALRRV